MSARIYGSVFNSTNGTKITSAVVSAPGYSVTNSSGTYFFTTPGAATVAVTASAVGFSPQTQNVTVADGANKKADFSLTPL